VTRGYGAAGRPEDFLDNFTSFVRNNENKITALAVVVQRPRELTQAQLRELQLELANLGFTDTALRTAWQQSKNEDIAASIIGLIRQAAIGDPLEPFEDRVHKAIRKIESRGTWTQPQWAWLRRISEQLVQELVVDHAALDEEPFRSEGGFTRLNKVFNGKLESPARRHQRSNVEACWLMAGLTTTRDIVAKLWNLCHILRDDGVTYNEYVTELTFLLFLKMMAETGREDVLPNGYRWNELTRRTGLEQLDYYKRLLLDLGTKGKATVAAIFVDAQTRLRKPTNLKALTDAIDELDWFSAREEGLGNLYEGLLEKNAAEKKSGAGQYFTPRPLIDCIVRLTQPQPGEIIQDPAAGTGGFLVAADRYIADHYIKERTDDLFKLSREQIHFQKHNAFVGLELVPDAHRLCLMNLMLHGIEEGVDSGDPLWPDGASLPKADLILTNPPFGTKKGGGRPNRSDFSITADTSNQQLAFIEHIVRAIKPGGRATFVVPDNVLFEDNNGRRLRTWMMELCDLHTVLRLPTGIF
jgi:hypothetical protein